MNDKPNDLIGPTLRQWTTELTAALTAAGFDCRYQAHGGNSSVRLGKLMATLIGTNEHYPIDFERKLIVRRDGDVVTRTLITALEVYQPHGGLHVHISKFSPETVAKIVGYAKAYVEDKIAKEKAREAQRERMSMGCAIAAKAFANFEFPSWAEARANCMTDDEVGTFRLSLSYHRTDFPLTRLTPAQVKTVINTIRNLDTPPVSAWQPVSVPVPPELQSTAMEYKLLLLAIPGHPTAVRGWFLGGLVNEFYMEGSPSQWKPTHWMPLPSLPV